MRQTLLAATAAFLMGGIVTGAVLSRAQPAPPPVALTDGMPPRMGEHGGMGMGPHAGPWMHRHGWGRGREMMRTFALVYRQRDRALSPADAQKIAEAFLLWNGNHSWKVADAAMTADGLIGFTLTTQDGSPIAKFTMDPHTARVARVG